MLVANFQKKSFFLVARGFSVDIIYIMNENSTVCSVFPAVTGFSLLLRR